MPTRRSADGFADAMRRRLGERALFCKVAVCEVMPARG
jgi:hypothetical protein